MNRFESSSTSLMQKSFFLENEAATDRLAQQLAHQIDDQALVIYLIGDLGSGKTHLCRHLLHCLGHKGSVKSPTYTLIEPYRLTNRTVLHCDLYRLSDPEELEYLGLNDELDSSSLLLIEWPEKGAGYLPQADLVITIKMSGEGRTAQLHDQTERGLAVTAGLTWKT